MSEYTLGPVQWTSYGNRMCRYEILKPDNNPCHRIYCLTYIAAGGDQRLRIKKLTIQHPDEYWCSPTNSCNKPKSFKQNKCTPNENKILRWEIFAVNTEQRWINSLNEAIHQPYYVSWALGNSDLVLVNYDADATKRGRIERFVVEDVPGEYDFSTPHLQNFYVFQQNQFMTETVYPALNQNAPIVGQTSVTNTYQIVTDEDKIGVILFKPEITLGHALYVGGSDTTPAMNVKFKIYLRPRLICVYPLLSHLLANQGAMDDLPPVPHFEHRVPVQHHLEKVADPPPKKPTPPCITTCQKTTTKTTTDSLQSETGPESSNVEPERSITQGIEEMEVDKEKHRNVLDIIAETTQSDTVPRPISPSEVPDGPAVDESNDVRGKDNEEDDIDGLLSFDTIYFAYSIYTDMFKQSDCLETFIDYIRRNAKLERIAEKLVDAYKSKKKT
nr:VP1 [Scorpion polyomavirus 2]